MTTSDVSVVVVTFSPGETLKSFITSLQTATDRTVPVVLADREQLKRLFQNLISNSLKFRADGRPLQVRVTARREGTEWVVEVTAIAVLP